MAASSPRSTRARSCDPCKQAKRAGIPTVVIDSALASDDACQLRRDWTTRRAAHSPPIGSATLTRLGRGRDLLLRYQEGSASTEAREKGLLNRMKGASTRQRRSC